MLCEFRPNGIEMNVPEQFQKIRVFLAKDCFESILEDMSESSAMEIVVLRVAQQDALHDR
ncbi:MAG: hypothetical protein A3G41_05210 [Elusimicrobia bacterium RIFCSPLOWO2_12_FULL_59_9]|nr:MAG: hypothetical protein A3G41_05210 [Elusimicrobia bacterium RIFCSPLOWO2_12_FULL_59_9]